ncbi:MAG: undecaprenyldiphospho-muramoylpentapeptide beta-N-acetylglucosaminyltransferase [Bacteroidia bacterium]|nr:undecaprenyldiphospho-muramoylpentapeptide beta-N-acetylglucosaminyltransferase [Bacteroidia bacterium]
MISGGGTGGHIFPAVAIAKELRLRYPECELLFIGANGRMEMEKVPLEGFRIIGLDVAGLRRSFSPANIKVAFQFVKSYFKARKIIKEFKPDIAVGTGGYASLAVLYAAGKMNIPMVIWEGNGFAGLANKILAKNATTICTGLPNMEAFFPASKTVFTGNPVRAEILQHTSKSQAIQFFKLDESKPVLFITGGSLGARTINNTLEKIAPELLKKGIQIIWQTGKNHQSQLQDDGIKIFPFLKEMHLAYAAADLIVSRAGALSIAEIAAVGKPAILIPSPNVTDDHQTQNALKLTDNKAAVLLTDKEAPEILEDTIVELIFNPDALQSLEKNLKVLAKPDATKAIVNEIEKVWKPLK